MYVSSIGRINDAAFGTQQNNAGRMALANSGGDMNSIHQADKRYQLDNLQNQLQYKYLSAMEEKEKKQEKEDIKRSFSTFA